jgi:hypothetical protein
VSYSSSSGQTPEAACCEHSNETPDEKFLDWLQNCYDYQEALCYMELVRWLDRNAAYTPTSRRVLESVEFYLHDPHMPSL